MMKYEDWERGKANMGESDFYEWGPDDDETMVDLGGGMVVPLRELMENDD